MTQLSVINKNGHHWPWCRMNKILWDVLYRASFDMESATKKKELVSTLPLMTPRASKQTDPLFFSVRSSFMFALSGPMLYLHL